MASIAIGDRRKRVSVAVVVSSDLRWSRKGGRYQVTFYMTHYGIAGKIQLNRAT
jgi:hypothetical protein